MATTGVASNAMCIVSYNLFSLGVMWRIACQRNVMAAQYKRVGGVAPRYRMCGANVTAIKQCRNGNNGRNACVSSTAANERMASLFVLMFSNKMKLVA